MSNEIIETAKATQEVAKATTKGLEVSEKVGFFVAKVLGEPIEQAVGILGDKLKFMRWERKIRLIDRVEEISEQRGNVGKEIPVPPKLAIPIIENASLEEDNLLQDLWAKMIVSAQDHELKSKVRSAFIDIIKQLESRDVIFLDALYRSALSALVQHPEARETNITFPKSEIIKGLNLEEREYENIVDNLMRVRCLKSEVKVMPFFSIEGESATVDKGYDSLCFTELGVSFVESCIK